MVEACGYVCPADLFASKVEAALDALRAGPKCGTQTSNHILGAVKGFAAWLVKDRRLPDNPLAHLAGGNVRLDRRDLSDAKLIRLFAAAWAGRALRGLTGANEMLYVASLYTGLRASGLASPDPASVDLGPSRR